MKETYNEWVKAEKVNKQLEQKYITQVEYHKKYAKTPNGKLSSLIRGAKYRGFAFIPLVIIEYENSYAICWHHVNDKYVIPVPREIHQTGRISEVEHRKLVNAWIESTIGLTISDLIQDTVY